MSRRFKDVVEDRMFFKRALRTPDTLPRIPQYNRCARISDPDMVELRQAEKPLGTMALCSV